MRAAAPIHDPRLRGDARPRKNTIMKNPLKTLEALLNDVTGNLAMGNSKNAAGYLKSLGLLADALSRQCQQQFELGVIEELQEMAPSGEVAEGIQTKRKLNQRELELSKLEVELADFFAGVSSRCFISAKDAATNLRTIADAIEKQEGSELFPKPMAKAELKAWAEQRGMQFVDSTEPGAKSFLDDLVAASKVKKNGKGKHPTTVSRRGT